MTSELKLPLISRYIFSCELSKAIEQKQHKHSKSTSPLQQDP